MAFLVIYTLFALLVALVGDNKSPGFWGSFFICLLLSPVIGLIILLCLPTKRREVPQQAVISQPVSVADELEKLKKLHDNGTINEDEYQSMRSKVMANFG